MRHGQRFLVGSLVVVLAAALALIATGRQSTLAEGTIIYVNAGATGGSNGSSWADAFTTLQPALNAAASGDQIWVAEGSYKPTVEHGGSGSRYRSFQMKNGVAIYGGFNPPVDDTWEERDWVNNLTTLSGDIGILDDTSDNCYHVFYHPPELGLDRSAILDGFRIIKGNANLLNTPHAYGGGMYNDGSSPVLANCTFEGNVADSGGGLYNALDSSPALTNCTFSNNSAEYGGGGIFNGNSSPTLSDVIIDHNTAPVAGGGMSNMYAMPILSNVTFEENSAGWGGGIYNLRSYSLLTECAFAGNSAERGGGLVDAESSSTLIDCTFADNYATNQGGGVYILRSWSPTLTSCTFSGNSAGSEGGGLYNDSYSEPVLTKVSFLSNSAYDGGGMYNYHFSSPVLSNCIFWNNQATESAGAMYNYYFSSPVLTNCTFTGNHATYTGGMVNQSDSNPVVTNCILWGDTDTIGNVEISNPNSTPVVTYSDVQGGHIGTGNIDQDPLYLDPVHGDLHLRWDSPCIDAGDNAAPNLPAYDIDGDPRILDGDGNGTAVVDMGVDEAWGPPPPVIYVDQDATGTNSGTSWADAFTDLQDALDWAVGGVEIWVAEGTYRPSVEHGGTGGRFKSFQMVFGVAIYGGFDPSVGDDTWEDRDWVNNVTVLSGDLNGDDGPDFANNDENSYHVLFHPWEMELDSSAILDGFTITGGNANVDFDDGLNNRGGGMGNFGTSPTVANCIFEGNWAALRGGGMFNNTASPVVTNCTFSGNRAGMQGGGMSNWASSPTVTGSTFEDNWTGVWGGGMRNSEGSAPVLIDCTFLDNEADGWGGGLVNVGGSAPVLINCTFSGNRAVREGGGGIYNTDSSPVLTNCTFWGNMGVSGGGMLNDATSSPVLTNCILWGDTAGGLPSEIAGGSPVVTHSDVQGGYLGTGNIDADPLLLGPANGDFHLSPGSPCIDVGNNAAPNLPDFDFEGDGRILDGDGNVIAVVDMGVDEVAIAWPYYRQYLPLVLSNY